MAPQESEGGANAIPAGQVMTDNVNGKPGSNENASSENERNVFVGSRSGLSDESGSNGRMNKRRLRENAGRRRSRSAKLRLPVERKSEAGTRPACGHASESLWHWPWRFS